MKKPVLEDFYDPSDPRGCSTSEYEQYTQAVDEYNRTRTIFKQPLIYANVKNSNDRIYTQEALDKIKEQLSEQIKKGRALGELGHPDRFEVTLNNTSHLVTDIYQEDDVLYGDIRILDTPRGRDLQNLMDADLIVFRPRSAGIVNEDGTVNIHQIYSFDAIPKSEDAWKSIEIEKDNRKWLLLIG